MKTGRVPLCAWIAVLGIIMGYGNSVAAGDVKSIMVYKHDGTLQCGQGKEITLKEMSKQLTAAGVTIIAQKKSDDGLTGC